MSTPRTKTGLSVKSAALRCDDTISATAPSSGEQNMYWVSGGLIGRDAAIASSVIGVRRNAEGVVAPWRYAFAATSGNAAPQIPRSYLYRWVFIAKNGGVSVMPCFPYPAPTPTWVAGRVHAPRGGLAYPSTRASSATPVRMA